VFFLVAEMRMCAFQLVTFNFPGTYVRVIYSVHVVLILYFQSQGSDSSYLQYLAIKDFSEMSVQRSVQHS